MIVKSQWYYLLIAVFDNKVNRTYLTGVSNCGNPDYSSYLYLTRLQIFDWNLFQLVKGNDTLVLFRYFIVIFGGWWRPSIILFFVQLVLEGQIMELDALFAWIFNTTLLMIFKNLLELFLALLQYFWVKSGLINFRYSVWFEDLFDWVLDWLLDLFLCLFLLLTIFLECLSLLLS